MSRSPVEKSSSFPGWVALSSLGIALWLFFANAVPANRERAELRALAGDLETLRRDYDASIAEARLSRGSHAHQDLQALLVAIDRLGLTPAELCAAYPEQPADRPEPYLEDGPVPPAAASEPASEPVTEPATVRDRPTVGDRPSLGDRPARVDAARAKFQ